MAHPTGGVAGTAEQEYSEAQSASYLQSVLVGHWPTVGQRERARGGKCGYGREIQVDTKGSVTVCVSVGGKCVFRPAKSVLGVCVCVRVCVCGGDGRAGGV